MYHIYTGLETITPLVISTTDLVSRYPSPLKGIRAPWKNSWLQSRVKIRLNIYQKVRKCSEINRDISKRQELERVLTGKIWDHRSIKMIPMNITLNEERTHENILIQMNKSQKRSEIILNGLEEEMACREKKINHC